MQSTIVSIKTNCNNPILNCNGTNYLTLTQKKDRGDGLLMG